MGLPLAILFAKRGFKIFGFDIDKHKINRIKNKKTHVASYENFYSIYENIRDNGFEKNSYIKFGSPEHVSSENIFNLGKELFKNNDYPDFNEVRLEYMREPDVSFSTRSLEGRVNFHD